MQMAHLSQQFFPPSFSEATMATVITDFAFLYSSHPRIPLSRIHVLDPSLEETHVLIWI